MIAITLNSVSINTSSQWVTRILHDHAPVMDINAMEIARRDGAILISTNFKPKEIDVEGIISASTRALLETAIDNFKRDLCKSNINLDISYAGSTRRYVVTNAGFSITRDGSDITRVRYSMKLICLTPFGIGTAEAEGMSVQAIVGASHQTTLTVDGTAPPQSTIGFTIDTAGNLGAIQVTNQTTGRQMTVQTAWTDGDNLVINCDGRTVQRNGTDVEFEGVFPTFDIGVNTVAVAMTTSTPPNPTQTATNTLAVLQHAPEYVGAMQSFKAPASANFDKISVMLGNYEMGSGVYLEVYSVSVGLPNTLLYTSNTIPYTAVTVGGAWIDFTFSPVMALTSGTTYFVKVCGGDNGVKWYATSPSVYAGGSAFWYNSKAGWYADTTVDLTFKLYQVDTPTYSIDWYIDYFPRYL